MNRKVSFAFIAILVLAIITAAWMYFHYSPAAEPAPTPAPVVIQANFAEELIKNWPAISKNIPVKAGEGGKWIIDNFRTLSSSTAIVAFEDGLIGHTVAIRQVDDDFKIGKIYMSQLQFTAAELNAIEKQYGDPAYVPRNFHISQGDGSLIEDSANLFLRPMTPSPSSASGQAKVKIAFLNVDNTLPDQTKPGDYSGCDHVILQEVSVPPTAAPLTAALNALLADREIWKGGKLYYIYNFAAKGDLKLQSASIQNGVAKIYLTGAEPGLAGECDDPRLFIQVAQTARQFSTVQDVFLWVNGVLQNEPPDVDMAP